jgi:hypothetical protein
MLRIATNKWWNKLLKLKVGNVYVNKNTLEGYSPTKIVANYLKLVCPKKMQ